MGDYGCGWGCFFVVIFFFCWIVLWCVFECDVVVVVEGCELVV